MQGNYVRISWVGDVTLNFVVISEAGVTSSMI